MTFRAALLKFDSVTLRKIAYTLRHRFNQGERVSSGAAPDSHGRSSLSTLSIEAVGSVEGAADTPPRLVPVEYQRCTWRFGLLCSVVVCLLSGCEEKKATAELNSGKEMIAALTPKVPVGTPVATAKTFMAAEGFSIEEKVKAKWKGKGPVDYLLCIRDDGQPPIKRHWEVALMHDGKAITSIDVRTALLYP